MNAGGNAKIKINETAPVRKTKNVNTANIGLNLKTFTKKSIMGLKIIARIADTASDINTTEKKDKNLPSIMNIERVKRTRTTIAIQTIAQETIFFCVTFNIFKNLFASKATI